MFPSTPLILWQFCYELSFSTTTMPYTWRFLEVTTLRKIRHAPCLIKRIQNIHPRIIGDSQMTVWKKYVSEVIFIGRERKLKNEENGTQENMLFFVTQYHQATKRKVVRMLVTITAVFAICWLPSQVYMVRMAYLDHFLMFIMFNFYITLVIFYLLGTTHPVLNWM